jgi:hypothetical protein
MPSAAELLQPGQQFGRAERRHPATTRRALPATVVLTFSSGPASNAASRFPHVRDRAVVHPCH